METNSGTSPVRDALYGIFVPARRSCDMRSLFKCLRLLHCCHSERGEVPFVSHRTFILEEMTRTKGEQKKRHNVVSTERVGLLGASLVAVGMAGFYFLPGMISDDATGSKFINAFYCSVITLTT